MQSLLHSKLPERVIQESSLMQGAKTRQYFKRSSEINLYAKYKLDELVNMQCTSLEQQQFINQESKQFFVRNIKKGPQSQDTYYYFGSSGSSPVISMTDTKYSNQRVQQSLKKSSDPKQTNKMLSTLPQFPNMKLDTKYKCLTQPSSQKKQKTIIVLFGNIVDTASIQVSQIDLPNRPKNLSELYKFQESFVKQCQYSFNQNSQLKILYQPNMTQISFIEEISKTFQFVIISQFSSCRYWQRLLQINEIKIKLDQKIQSKLINAFNQITDPEEFKMKLKSRSFLKQIILTGQTSINSMEPDFSITKTILTNYDNEQYSQMSPSQVSSFLSVIKQKNTIIPDKVTFNRHRDSKFLEVNDSRIRKQDLQENQTNQVEDVLMDEHLEQDLKRDFIMMDQKMTAQQLKKLIPQEPTMVRRERKKDTSLQKQKTDFIKDNKSHYDSKIAKINSCLPILQNLNIPMMIEQVAFDRKELYNIYCRFKSLVLVQNQQKRDLTIEEIKNGIDFNTFYQSLDDQMFAQKEMIHNLFINFSEFNRMNWEQYCQAVNLLRAKNLTSKMKLIMKLLDKNRDGVLSFEEINDKSLKMLQMLMSSKGKDPSGLSDFMTRTIFDAVNVKYDEEIQISQIKSMIEIDHPEVQLLLMICCGDVEAE